MSDFFTDIECVRTGDLEIYFHVPKRLLGLPLAQRCGRRQQRLADRRVILLAGPVTQCYFPVIHRQIQLHFYQGCQISYPLNWALKVVSVEKQQLFRFRDASSIYCYKSRHMSSCDVKPCSGKRR